MLRVAVISRYFPSSAEPWQGRSAYEELRVLARHAEVKVFYPNAAYPSWFKPRSRMYDRLDLSYGTPDVAVNYFNYPALPLISRVSNGWMASRTLLPPVQTFAPHLIFAYFLYPEGFAALKLARELSVPLVVKAIGSDINRIGDPISRFHTRSVLRNADFLLTVSEDLRKKAVAMGAPAKKSRTMLNGCDHSIFHIGDRHAARAALGIDGDAISIVYVGRIDIRKGLRELVEAVVSVRLQQPDVQLYLVGTGPDRNLIQERIKSFDAESYIHLQGACAPGDVPLWMAASDLVTLPSYMEGCPNVVLEALACGRPVVATAVGGIPEILNEECGCLVAPQDVHTLAHGLATVLKRRLDAPAISAHSTRTWETLASEYLKLFEEVTSGVNSVPEAGRESSVASP